MTNSCLHEVTYCTVLYSSTVQSNLEHSLFPSINVLPFAPVLVCSYSVTVKCMPSLAVVKEGCSYFLTDEFMTNVSPPLVATSPTKRSMTLNQRRAVQSK